MSPKTHDPEHVVKVLHTFPRKKWSFGLFMFFIHAKIYFNPINISNNLPYLFITHYLSFYEKVWETEYALMLM